MSNAHQRGDFYNNKETVMQDDKTKIITLKPKALSIIWGGEGSRGKYWKYVKEGSTEWVELLGVYWLEVSGKIPLTEFSGNTKYKLHFIIKLKPDADGWDGYDVFVKLRLPGLKLQPFHEKLSSHKNKTDWFKFPQNGFEFTVPDKSKYQGSRDLSFAMYEIECEEFKKGLCIKEVTIEQV